MTLAQFQAPSSILRRGSSGGNPRTAFHHRLRGKFTGGYYNSFLEFLETKDLGTRSQSSIVLP
ncbi:hypothetical protein CY34DRAFT_810232, partial [Suillus luteus UH-Slu-Lm8-n1]